MPSHSVSVRLTHALSAMFSFLLPVMVYFLVSTAASAQVTYNGSEAVNFGSQAIGSASMSKSLTFSIASGTTIGSIGVLTAGIANLDFTEATGSTCTATTYASSTSCQVNVTFKPREAGLRMGAVVFFSGANNAGTVLASAFVYGVGTGPQIAYGPGTQTGFYFPSGNPIYAYSIAVDAAGNLFFGGYSGVLEIPAGGGAITIIEPTVNGLGLNGPGGVAVDGAGDLFIADSSNNRVVEVPVGGGAAIALDPTVKGLKLNDPTAVTVDGAGDLFIADSFNNRVVEAPAGGGPPVAINPTVDGLSLAGPSAVAMDAAGDLFIADTGRNRAVKVPAGGGAPVAIDPTVDGVSLASPFGVAVDAAGDLFIADLGHNRLVEIPAGGGTSTVINSQTGWGIAVDGGGDLFLAFREEGPALEVPRAQPPALSFATTHVGVTSTDSPQTMQIANIGNEALMFTGLSYPPDFPLAAGDMKACTASTILGAGQECDLSIDFTPQHGIKLNENVILKDNALNLNGAQQSVPVIGTGVSTVAVKLGIVVPGSATVGRAYPFTVTAYGADGNPATGYSGIVTFSSSDPGATLPGASHLNSGSGIFFVTFGRAGQATITATDTANHLTVTSTAIRVTANFVQPITAPDEWTWMGGSSTIGPNCTPNQLGLNCGRPGVYGTLGKPAPGNAPGARSGAQSWTDGNGNLWLFGGTGFDGNGTYGSLNDLWELDPSTDYWTWMGGSSAVPGEFGGWPGVYGNLGTAAPGNMPGSRSGASTWTDRSGNLWLFGGSGFDAVGQPGYLNDLWEFKHSLKQWVWMGGSSTIGSTGGQQGTYGQLGTPAAGNMPGSRSGASSWTDRRGRLWLFGGASFSGNEFFYSTWYLNDLWEFFPDRNEWAWMGGSNSNNPTLFTSSASCDPYGGCGWSGAYGSLGLPANGNSPGSRSGGSSWTDERGHLWLLGGYGFDSAFNSSGYLNDLWEFNPATQEWTWTGGSNTVPFELGGQPGTYGTLGSPAAANIPGGRIGASSWTDRRGHFWLYGGAGIDSGGIPGELNDLWMFDPSLNTWAWMSGSSTTVCLPQNNGNCGQPGVYGLLGTPQAGNVPGGRSGASSWIDKSGNLWLFGGVGYDSIGNANRVPDSLNDLWQYEPPHRCDSEWEDRHGCYDERDPRRHHHPESRDGDE